MTLAEFKKSSYRRSKFFKEIKTQEDLDSFAAETRELTQNGNYECVYELAQMDRVDMDDIFALIR